VLHVDWLEWLAELLSLVFDGILAVLRGFDILEWFGFLVVKGVAGSGLFLGRIYGNFGLGL
jgi:hypothetical protein